MNPSQIEVRVSNLLARDPISFSSAVCVHTLQCIRLNNHLLASIHLIISTVCVAGQLAIYLPLV